jgi:hypothetical protein
MMRRSYLWALWPVALVACSSTTPPSQQSVSTSGASSGSASGSQGESGSATGSGSGSEGSGSSTGTAASGTSASGNGSGSASGAGIDAAPTSEASTSEEGGSDGGGACPGIFCEDFEEGAMLDTTKWDVATGGNASQDIQQQIVAHGSYAWHVHGGPATGGMVAHGDFATIMAKMPPALTPVSGPLFGRASFYATPNNNPHCQLGFAGTNPNMGAAAPMITSNGINFNYMEFAEFGGGSWQLGFDLFTPASSVANGFVEEASYTHPSMQAPVKQWACVEWEFNDNPTMMVFWVNGTQIDQFDVDHLDYHSVAVTPGSILNGKTSGIIGGYTVFGFGFHAWGGGNPFDYYYDDIVLSTKRVGCLQ